MLHIQHVSIYIYINLSLINTCKYKILKAEYFDNILSKSPYFLELNLLGLSLAILSLLLMTLLL